MPKTTIRAGSNIAFIKYWGVDDERINLPQTSSISMTLAAAHTTTTVQWSSEWGSEESPVAKHSSAQANTGQDKTLQDEIVIDGRILTGEAGARIVHHLDRIRAIAGTDQRARVVSCNNFPMASGIASSASGFAALTVAAFQALSMDLDDSQLSALARLGSGSASRSLFGGFVQWDRGVDHETSVARQLFPPEHWELYDLVAIVSSAEKRVSSEGGHRIAPTSPLNRGRVEHVEKLLPVVQQAIADRDLKTLGEAVEWDALAMHAVMQTGKPSLLYWQPGTLEVLHAIRRWREEDGIEGYFTIDAGPNVHVLCEAQHLAVLQERVAALPSVAQVLVSGPGSAPYALQEHLF
jgi:diphosphomevalonate decarboxylase